MYMRTADLNFDSDNIKVSCLSPRKKGFQTNGKTTRSDMKMQTLEFETQPASECKSSGQQQTLPMAIFFSTMPKYSEQVLVAEDCIQYITGYRSIAQTALVAIQVARFEIK